MRRCHRRGIFWAAVIGLWLGGCVVRPAAAQYLRVRDICRVKGQEQNTLHGLGLVVGLEGTGDGDTPTTRALAKMMELMGSPVAIDDQRQPVFEELQNARNVAMAFVTATVPAEGARQGELLNVSVNAISATSLEGGHLMITPLRGPWPGDPNIYAYAQGPLARDRDGPPTAGKVHNGCRLEANFENAFHKDGMVTLVLDQNHASFRTAYDIEAVLNDPKVSGFGMTQSPGSPTGEMEPIAKAMDQVNVAVRIPEIYKEKPVEFVSEIMDMQIIPPRHDARVVIDKRNGVIIVGEDVMVGRVAVSHENIAIQTGNDPAGNDPPEGPLFVVDQNSDTTTTRLQALVDALNALKVSTEDIIEIIEALEHSGDLYGKLIVK